MSLRILADKNIPHVLEAFHHVGAVSLMEGRSITRAAIGGINVLLTRSVTQVAEKMITGSSLQFVGSATIGTDHIDLAALAKHNVAFAHARDAGGESVAEYVTAALLLIASRENRPLDTFTLGIVGCGNIGSRVRRRAQALGMRVMENDPPLAETIRKNRRFVPLDHLLRKSDIVTLHVPLLREGPHATYHLLGHAALHQMKPGAWLINTSRGPVVNGDALLNQKQLGGMVLDVWENEPTPNRALLRRANLATPHIAGHSYDGKLLGTILLYQAVTSHFGLSPAWDFAALQRPPAPLVLTPPDKSRAPVVWLDELVRTMYDLRADDARTRSLLDIPSHNDMGKHFSALRTTYPRRRAFRLHQIAASAVPQALHCAVRDGLGITLIQ